MVTVTYHRVTIVLADPKYPDQNTSKVRPLLIISSSEFHYNTRYAICVGITTSKEPDPYLIRLPRTEIKNGRLQYDSQIMCHRITTLQQDKLRTIAKITPDLYTKIIKKIKHDVINCVALGISYNG